MEAILSVNRSASASTEDKRNITSAMDGSVIWYILPLALSLKAGEESIPHSCSRLQRWLFVLEHEKEFLSLFSFKSYPGCSRELIWIYLIFTDSNGGEEVSFTLSFATKASLGVLHNSEIWIAQPAGWVTDPGAAWLVTPPSAFSCKGLFNYRFN